MQWFNGSSDDKSTCCIYFYLQFKITDNLLQPVQPLLRVSSLYVHPPFSPAIRTTFSSTSSALWFYTYTSSIFLSSVVSRVLARPHSVNYPGNRPLTQLGTSQNLKGNIGGSDRESKLGQERLRSLSHCVHHLIYIVLLPYC